MKCTDCKYCVEQDYGYSNYTVEGTDVYCLKKMNPSFPKDRFYGEELGLLFANECDSFIKGDNVSIDCDRNEPFPDGYSDDEEIKSLLVAWDSGQ